MKLTTASRAEWQRPHNADAVLLRAPVYAGLMPRHGWACCQLRCASQVVLRESQGQKCTDLRSLCNAHSLVQLMIAQERRVCAEGIRL